MKFALIQLDEEKDRMGEELRKLLANYPHLSACGGVSYRQAKIWLDNQLGYELRHAVEKKREELTARIEY